MASLMTSGLTAKRFAGKPLIQPRYNFRDVPKCKRDLTGSLLQEVTEREHFESSMAEIILLVKEVMRRQNLAAVTQRGRGRSGQGAPVKISSKPLSLEYIADRIDVDDPVSGFFVRTAAPSSSSSSTPATRSIEAAPATAAAAVPPAPGAPPPTPRSDKLIEGMLQGFAVVTTFTNWQKTFRWDSMHDSAFSYDEEDLACQMMSGERKYDRDGSLAEAMQSTVRCGDPWNEGIVWPRIAELSLLGGLGCGKALLSLIIERLECTPPSGKRNYDYIVLQATENSVSFYESCGFVRVGCITKNEDHGKDDSKEASAEAKVGSGDVTDKATGSNVGGASSSPSAAASAHHHEPEIVTSGVETYVTKRPWEKPSEIAAKLNVDVWDVIFLNKDVFPDIRPSSGLKKGTSLFYPTGQAKLDAPSNGIRTRSDKGGSSSTVQWYLSLDNEMPREIAKKFNVKCSDLVNANKERIAGLQPSSRLIEGTRLQVSHFDVHHDTYTPYCHWTFPDDTLESGEPSYMMARKLNRRPQRGPASKRRPVECSFAVPVTKYIPPPVIPAMPKPPFTPNHPTLGSKKKASKSSKKRKLHKVSRHPDEPVPPKRPMTAFFYYMKDMREKEEFKQKAFKDVAKIIACHWKEASEGDKAKYVELAGKGFADYRLSKEKYNIEMEAFRKANPEWVEEQRMLKASNSTLSDDGSCSIGTPAAKKSKIDAQPRHLFNKVVKLNGDGIEQEGTEFTYYYVLTYLPDLQWCHLAPMRKAGHFGKNKPKAEGRPRWMLVDENEGKEADVSASFCEVVKSRAMKGCEDADREEWDIFESGPSIGCSSGVNAPKKEKVSRHPDEPIPPKKPMTAFFFFMKDKRDEFKGGHMKDTAKILSARWNGMGKDEKVKYEEMNEKAKAEYSLALEKHKAEMEAFKAKIARLKSTGEGDHGACDTIINETKIGAAASNDAVDSARTTTACQQETSSATPVTQSAPPDAAQLHSCSAQPQEASRSSPCAVSSGTTQPLLCPAEDTKESSNLIQPVRNIRVGSLVEVASRMWPGLNKPGGAARVTKLHLDEATSRSDDGPSPTHVDVKYIVEGGREKKVPIEFVAYASHLEEEDSSSANPESGRGGSIPSTPRSAAKRARQRQGSGISPLTTNVLFPQSTKRGKAVTTQDDLKEKLVAENRFVVAAVQRKKAKVVASKAFQGGSVQNTENTVEESLILAL